MRVDPGCRYAHPGYAPFRLPDRDAAADGAVEHLRRALDALGCRVQRIGDRGLRLPRAVDGGGADAAEVLKLLLAAADAGIGIQELVADGERSHHGQALIADLAELAAELLDAGFEALGELEQPHFLP